MKKNFIYLCLIVIIVLIACSGKEDDKKETIQNKEDKTITIAEKAEIKTLDPQKTVDSASLSVIQMINQRLVNIDNDGNIVFEIAKEIKTVDAKTTLVKIKDNIKFSNGETLTIDDVLFSLNRAKESPRMTKDFYMIESFEKVDDSTIKVKTFYEAGNLLHKLASMGASIMNKKALEENENNIIGSGMFKLKEWVAGDRIVLERNEYFKEANSNVKEIIIKFIPEANSRMIMLETGEVDIAEAGYPNGFDIVLNLNEDNQRVDTAVVIQDNLKAIGINVQIKTYQWASYVAFVENPSQEKGMFLMAWNIANDDPDELLYPLYHSSQIDAHTNVIFYKNEDFDSLISKARETIDKEKRIDLYKKAQDIIQEDLPHYAILYPMQNFAYKKNIKGIGVNKRGYFNFQNTISKY